MPSHPHTHGLTVDPGQDTWRTVVIDDRVPVDLFGRPLLVGCMPLALWPLLLSKAVLKVRVERGTRCAVPVSVSVLHPHVRLIPHLFCDDECVVEGTGYAVPVSVSVSVPISASDICHQP